MRTPTAARQEQGASTLRWRIEIEATPAPGRAQVTTSQRTRLLDVLPPGGGVFAYASRIGARFDVDAPDLAAAVEEALARWEHGVAACRLERCPVVKIAVSRS